MSFFIIRTSFIQTNKESIFLIFLAINPILPTKNNKDKLLSNGTICAPSSAEAAPLSWPAYARVISRSLSINYDIYTKTYQDDESYLTEFTTNCLHFIFF